MNLHQAAYRFFDVPFVLESDDSGFLTSFEEIYRHFKGIADPINPRYRVTLLGQPAIEIDNQILYAAHGNMLRPYAFSACINTALRRVRSHYLFHAAALATPNDDGIIITGHSGMGKTTLTLALLERGFRYLSDDIAAVGRRDSLLYPFPRSLGVRTGNNPLKGKHQIDPFDLGQMPPHNPETALVCPVRFLLMLSEPDENKSDKYHYLVIDHLPEPLLCELRAISGVQKVRVLRDKPFPIVRIYLDPGTLPSIEPQIVKVCQDHRTVLFELAPGREAPPDFNREPKLTPLSASQAARELLRHYQGGWCSKVLQEDFHGNASRLYLALIGLTTKMDCYRLDVGNLDVMVENIISTVEYRDKI